MGKNEPFPSLFALKNAHRDLIAQRRQGVDDAWLAAVTQFIERGSATGCLLEDDEARWDAQNLLDYWSNELFHNERKAPDATLAEFDPSTLPRLLDSQCPYLGLDAFNTNNHDYFFGRDKIIKKMIARLQNGRFLAIIGPSGSGKSSTALAGLLPQLQNGALPGSREWTYLPPLMPGAHPLESLANSLVYAAEPAGPIVEQLAQSPTYLADRLDEIAPNGAVLIIDQFEELYTLCHDNRYRLILIDSLIEVLQRDANLHTIIITMRTDLESNLMRTAVFQNYYAQYQVRLPPMDATQLRATIEKPAELAGLRFEEGLIDQLIRDVLGEPSALPLLQFTLLKLWENREKNRITWNAYSQLGGGRQVIANSANTFFNHLPAADRPVVRSILLRLVQFGLGPEVARDRIFKHELYTIAAEKTHIDTLLSQLVSIRLVRLIRASPPNEDKVELAHEALLTHWPRLVAWLEESRVTQRRRIQLNGMAQQWESLNQDPSTLLRGLLLEEAQQYNDLDEVESAFVAASIQARDQEAEQREQRRIRQLRQVQALAEERQLRLNEKEKLTQWLSSVSIALAIVFAVAVIAGLLAAQNANTAQNNALTAVASEATAVANKAIADALRETAVANADQLATAEANARQERDQATENERLALLAQQTAVASFQEADSARATAEASAIEADTQFRLATARELANAALEQLTGNPQLSVLLALESIYFPLHVGQEPPIETADVLYRSLLASQLQRILSGHTDWVTDVAVSPDGMWIATSGHDGSVRIWQADNGQEQLRIDKHDGHVNSVAISNDGTRLATAGDDGFVFVWDTADFSLLAALPDENNGAVQSVAFHPDGRRLVAAYADATIRVWDSVARQSLLRLFGHTQSVKDVTFSPDGYQIASADGAGSVIVWNAETGTPLYSLERTDNDTTIGANAVAFHPDSKRLVIAYDDGVVSVWDGQTLLYRLSGHNNFVLDATFSHDGLLIATAGGDGIIKVWDSENGRVNHTITGHSGGVTAVQFTPDDTLLVTAGQDNTAKIWRTAPGISPMVFSGHSASILNAAYNTAGRWIVTVSADRTALVWDVATGQIVHVFAQHNGAVNDAAFSPDNGLLATASDDAFVRLWPIEGGEAVFLPHVEAVNAVSFNPAGSQLATASDDGIVRLWDVTAGTVLLRITFDTPIHDIAFNPGGDLLAIGDDAGNLYIWSVADDRLAISLSGHTGPVQSVAFHPDGSRIATASGDGTARLWSLDGTILHTFTGHNGPVTAVAFHPDGKLLATAGTDRTVKLWNIETGQNVRTFLGHTSTVTAVTFSPDGKDILTAGVDRTAQINMLLTVTELFERAWRQMKVPIGQGDCFQFLHGLPCITTSIPGPVPLLAESPTP